jgi:hypothetical protein
MIAATLVRTWFVAAPEVPEIANAIAKIKTPACAGRVFGRTPGLAQSLEFNLEVMAINQ